MATLPVITGRSVAKSPAITQESPYIGKYLGPFTSDPSARNPTDFYLYSGTTTGTRTLGIIYEFVYDSTVVDPINRRYWKAVALTDTRYSEAVTDLIELANANPGSVAYAEDYLDALAGYTYISKLFANNIAIASGGSIRGGTRYDASGNVVSAAADGFWLGSNGTLKLKDGVLVGGDRYNEAGTDSGAGTGYWLSSTGSLKLYGGTLEAGTITGSSFQSASGLVSVAGSLRNTITSGSIQFEKASGGSWVTTGYINGDNILFDTADNNTALGYGNFTVAATGDYNVAVGTNCLTALTSGNSNVAIGFNCLPPLTFGNSNVAIGSYVGLNMTTSTANIAIGTSAGRYSSGDFNVCIGVAAMYGVDGSTTGGSNVAIGSNSIQYLTTGELNVAVGFSSLRGNTTGSGNVAIGTSALVYNTTAINNVGIGYAALSGNISGITGSNNVGIGSYAITSASTAFSNVGVGNYALNLLTTGSTNVAVGHYAMGYSTTAISSVGIGFTALRGDSSAKYTGFDDVAIGSGAMQNATSCHNNVAFGKDALLNITSGIGNIGIGSSAGEDITTGVGKINIGIDTTTANMPNYSTNINNRLISMNFLGGTNTHGELFAAVDTILVSPNLMPYIGSYGSAVVTGYIRHNGTTVTVYYQAIGSTTVSNVTFASGSSTLLPSNFSFLGINIGY